MNPCSDDPFFEVGRDEEVIDLMKEKMKDYPMTIKEAFKVKKS